MRADYTEILMIIDRSGSMETGRDHSEKGINDFIKKQAEDVGETRITLIQFDDKYEIVHNGILAGDIPEYKLVPRNSTALLDAVGRGINTHGQRLAAMNEKDRPGLIIVFIVTDGQENASTDFTYEHINNIIKHQKDVYNWQFTFLGAGIQAFEEGVKLGIDVKSIAKFDKTLAVNAYEAVYRNTSRMKSASLAGELIDCSYTDEERISMDN